MTSATAQPSIPHAPWRIWTALGLLTFALFAAGCVTNEPVSDKKNEAPLVARFFLEAKRGETGVPVTLPRSGLEIMVSARPVVVEYDIINAEVVQVELGRCLMVQLTPAASRDLYRLSVPAIGRRLVLSLNDQFVGARQIDAAMAEGVILIFLELPDEELAPLVARLKTTSAQLAEVARKAKK